MSISPSLLTSGSDGTNKNAGEFWTTASITPTANRPVLLIVSVQGIVGRPGSPSISGAGLTWSLAKTQIWGSLGRIDVFVGISATPSPGAITITNNTNTANGAVWDIIDLDGADPSGTVVQSAGDQGTTPVGGLVTLTLGAFSHVNNATFGFFTTGSSTYTPGGGFTELSDHGGGTGAPTLGNEWRAENDTSVDCTISGGSGLAWGGIAIEVKAATAAPTGAPPFLLHRPPLRIWTQRRQ